MPLRLTGTTPASDGPALGPDASIEHRARALLSGGDLAGYRRLAADTAALADPQRRYVAQLRLVEAGVTAGRAADTVSGAAAAMAAAAETAIAALEQQPCEPLLLQYAGLTCLELWAPDAARALLRAAQRLEPSLRNLSDNLAEADRRRRARRPARPVHAAVSGLARRAVRVAQRAQLRRPQTISLCMIVRDEERMLGRCLAAAAPAVDEIVIVDTGSRDETIAIARRFGAHVIEREWTGSFADARNVSFDAATGDWLLYLDADEVLADGDAPRLRALAAQTWREAFYLVETSFTGELGGGTAVNHNALRMLRNRPSYRFEGRIHEQIAHTLPTWAPGRLATSAVRIEHYGYLGEVRDAKEKFTRNIELLQRQERESGPSAFLAHNLATEYGAAGDYHAAAAQFRTAWTMLRADGTAATAEFAPATASGLARTLRVTGRLDESDACALEGLQLWPDFTDLVFERAETALARGDRAGARALYERCMEMGDAPARYGGMVGIGGYRPRAALSALALSHDGDPARARELLGWCVAHHPEYVAAAAPYVTASVRCGIAPAAVVAELDAVLADVTPALRRAIAEALARAGAADAAEEQYERLLAEPAGDDSDGFARTALAELLLGRGAFAEAIMHVSRIADDSPRAALARRIEIAARMAGGDVVGARAVLAASETAGVPAVEREMLAAWAALAAGETPERALPVAAVPLAATLMEILLGAGARQGFAQLRELLESSQLSVRDRRQLVAEAQLRHGDLAGAAGEWMAVCEQAPDAQALLGLAQVAAATGMTADALTFAGGALELDPECVPAQTLLHALHGAAAPADVVPAAAGVDR